MKSNSLIAFILAAFFLTNCGDNKAATSEKEQTNNSSPEKKDETGTGSSEQSSDIIGEWELVGAIVDTNDNLQLDDDERKNLKPASFKDYMKLTRDGTGLFTIAKMNGRYEITDPKNDGKKFLTWYDEANGPHKMGTILKVTKDELHLKEVGGSGLIIWKRL